MLMRGKSVIQADSLEDILILLIIEYILMTGLFVGTQKKKTKLSKVHLCLLYYVHNININVYNINYQDITAMGEVPRKSGRGIKITLSFQMGSSPFSEKSFKRPFIRAQHMHQLD